MKLLYLKLINYRIHREISVGFDPQMTVITGENETGKSTLVDGIYQALFLRHRGDTATHRAIQSKLHPGTPEVTLGFSIDNDHYEIYKSFTRSSRAIARLSKQNGGTWNNDQAEEQLARLLSKHGQGLFNSLIVRQGNSADNPTGEFREISALTERLRDLGGAAIVSTDQDTATERLVQDEVNLNVTQSNRPKAGGEWMNARERADAATRAYETVESRFQSLLDAERVHQESKKTIADTEPKLQKSREELEETNEDLATAQKLETEVGQKEFHWEKIRDNLEAQRKDLINLRGLADAKIQLEQDILPQRKKLEELESLCVSATKSLAQAQRVAEQQDREARARQREVELAESYRERLRLNETLGGLRENHRKVIAKQSEKFNLETALAGLSEVTDNALRAIESAEQKKNIATVRVHSMGARIHIVAAKHPVWIEDRSFGPAEEVSLASEAELIYGDELRLKIAPGINGELADAERELENATRTFDNLLSKLALQSVQEARDINAKRRELETNTQLVSGEIDHYDVNRLPRDIERTELEVTRISQRIDGLRQQGAESLEPTSIQLALEQVERLRQELTDSEKEAQRRRGELQSAQTSAESATQRLNAQNQKVRLLELDLNNAEGRIAAYTANGDLQSRSADVAKLQEKEMLARGEYEEARNALAALQPDTLQRRKSRLTDSIRKLESILEEAQKTVSFQQGAMQRGENEDPESELKQKRSEMEHANRRLKDVELRVKALQRTVEIYEELKHEAVNEYGRTLGERIREYLQQLYGFEAQAIVDMDINQGAVDELKVSRPSLGCVAFEFDSLSGGTMEQVGAAARLAMAEIMCSNSGGTLPVVLDDSFTNSDRDRIPKVMDMLTLAQEKGLQVIVVSCNPDNFRGLGGIEIRLPNPNVLTRLPTGIKRDFARPEVDTERNEVMGIAPSATGVSEDQRLDFLRLLQVAGGRSASLGLKTALSWDDALYNAVKTDLLAQNKITVSRGRGGVVSLVT
jgi:DNA repair exonuclease SbcCD ATPase subunit